MCARKWCERTKMVFTRPSDSSRTSRGIRRRATDRIARCSLVRWKVQFNRDARRVFDEDLMQTKARHCALTIMQAGAFDTLDHDLHVGREKSQMVDGRTAVKQRTVLVSQVIDEPLGSVFINSDQVDNAVVGLVSTKVHPCARKLERRSETLLEPKDIAVKAPRRIKVRRPDREVG